MTGIIIGTSGNDTLNGMSGNVVIYGEGATGTLAAGGFH